MDGDGGYRQRRPGYEPNGDNQDDVSTNVLSYGPGAPGTPIGSYAAPGRGRGVARAVPSPGVVSGRGAPPSSSDPRWSDQRFRPDSPPRWDNAAPPRGSRLPRPDGDPRRGPRPPGARPPGARPPGPGPGAPEPDGLLPITTRRMVKRLHMPLWQELPLLLVVAFCLAVLIRTFLLQAFFIPSGSMEQTLLIGDRVLVNKMVYNFRGPERGEVVVFRGDDNWKPEHVEPPPSGLVAGIGRTLGDLIGISRPGEKDFIKRVIGVAGDRIRCCDANGNVVVNGVSLNESYIFENSPLGGAGVGGCRSRDFKELVVPANKLWVMGDHRGVSQDSRCQGPIGVEDVIGRAFVIVWPNERWTSLSVPETFANVPSGKPVADGRPPGLAPPSMVVDGVLLLPILASLAVSARSRAGARGRRRRLPS